MSTRAQRTKYNALIGDRTGGTGGVGADTGTTPNARADHGDTGITSPSIASPSDDIIIPPSGSYDPNSPAHVGSSGATTSGRAITLGGDGAVHVAISTESNADANNNAEPKKPGCWERFCNFFCCRRPCCCECCDAEDEAASSDTAMAKSSASASVGEPSLKTRLVGDAYGNHAVSNPQLIPNPPVSRVA